MPVRIERHLQTCSDVKAISHGTIKYIMIRNNERPNRQGYSPLSGDI